MLTNNKVQRFSIRSAALLLALGLLGCGGTQRQTSALVLRGPTQPSGTAQPRRQLRANSLSLLPQEAREALAQLGLPAMPATNAKGASVVLPYSFPADQQYTQGDAGYLGGSSDVDFPGPPFGGAELDPSGATFPDNFSFVLYRIDDIADTPGALSLSMGLSLGNVGLCVYDWAYGTGGRWEPLYYGSALGNIQVQLNEVAGADFTNDNSDLALVVFCLNPDQVNVSSFQLEAAGGGGGEYDEVEDNDELGSADAITFPLAAFRGNVGLGGTFDGDEIDIFTFAATAGDGVDFSITFDSAADYDMESNTGLLIGIVDQLYWDSGGVEGLGVLAAGTDGAAQVSHVFDGSEQAPFYFVVQNLAGDPPSMPATDYFVDASGPGSGGGEYDEIEDNDQGMANYLGDMDLNNAVSWLCSLGSDVGYPGYDGDLDDWFAFADIENGYGLNPGDVVTLQMLYDSSIGNFGMVLYDQAGTILDSSNSGDGEEGIIYNVTGAETQPLFINVTGTGYGDYTLNGTR